MALLKTVPGDIVAIPALKDGRQGFVLSRVIERTQVRTIEVFEGFYTNVAMTADEIRALELSVDKRLFAPVYAAFDFHRFYGKVKWPILCQDPEYNPEIQSHLSEIEFETERYAEVGEYMRDGQAHYEPKGVRRNLNDRTIYSNTQLMVRINLFMEGYFPRGTALNVMSARRFLADRGEDWYDAELDACITLADSVATQLKDAQRALKKKVHRALPGKGHKEAG